MDGLKRRPQGSFPFRALLVSRFESRKLLILMVVVITTITIDSQIGYIADFIPEQVSSDAGVAAFILMAVIFAVSQYFILGYVKQTNKENTSQSTTPWFNTFDSIYCTVCLGGYTSICHSSDHNLAAV